MSALQSSGAISLLNLRNYFSKSGTTSLADYAMGVGMPDKVSGTNIKTPGGRGYTAGGMGGTNSVIGASSGRQLFHNTVLSFDFTSEIFGTVLNTLSVGFAGAAGVSSSTKGYFCGGYNMGPSGATSSSISNIHSLAYTTETIASLAATLSVARTACQGISSSTKGYVTGSDSSGEIDGIDFGTETAINPSAVLSYAASNQTPMNSLLKGYLAGGVVTSDVNYIDSFIYSTESITKLAAVLEIPRWKGQGMENSTQGYVHGGRKSGTAAKDFGSDYTGITKLLYSNETTSLLSSQISATPTYGVAGTGPGTGLSSNTDGYAVMTYDGFVPYGTKGGISKLSFSSDTSSTLGSTVNVKTHWNTSLGVSNKTISFVNLNMSLSDYYGSVGGSAGFIAGSNITSSTPSANIHKFYFPSLTLASYIASLTSGRGQPSGISSKIKGYVGGGLSGTASNTQTNTLSALTFSTETVSSLTALSAGSFYYGTTAGNRNTGWFIGGFNGSSGTTLIQSLTYASETNATSAAALPSQNYGMSAGSLVAYAYIFGGTIGGGTSTTVTQFEFDTEATSTLSSTLASGRTASSTVTSTNATYCIGGTGTIGTPVNTIEYIGLATGVTQPLSSTLVANFISTSFYTPANGYIIGGANNQSGLNTLNFVNHSQSTSSVGVTTYGGAGLQSNNI